VDARASRLRAMELRQRSRKLADERRGAGRHHAVLADQQRHLVGAAVLGERRTKRDPRRATEDRRDLAAGGHHGISGRGLSSPGDMGPARLSQPHLFPRGRQGRSLRRVGGAGAVLRGAASGAPITAKNDLRPTAARTRCARPVVSARQKIRSKKDASVKTSKLLVAAVLAIAIGAPIAGIVGDINMAQPLTSTEFRFPFLHGFLAGQTTRQAELVDLARADEWLNSPPLTAQAMRGKVVLADFWTYACINWLRALPYVRAWHEKYRSKGLVVIGVHSPEFAFEKDLNNVRRAVKDMRIDYPVAVDSEHAIWRAF